MVSPQHPVETVDLADLQLTAMVLGGRWKTTILACLTREPMRFAALRRQIAGISEKVLSHALRDLEAEGLVTRTVEEVVPPRVTYAMSPHGRSLCDAVLAMARWGGHHRAVRNQASG